MSSAAKSSKQGFMLNPFEVWWSLNYDEILRHGYRLRDRYNKSAMDSWLHGDIDDDAAAKRGLLDIPDYECGAAKGMDAIRISDKALVWLKRCRLGHIDDPPESVHELRMNDMVLGDEDAHNHCLPIMDVFTVQDETSAEFLIRERHYVCAVFPWCLLVDRHPWRIAAEAIDFVRQMLEGLSFLHRRNIAHRDIHPGNVVMLPLPLFYKGIDPLRNTRFAALVKDAGAPYHDRIEVNARYSYIDLGLSTHFPGDNHDVTWKEGLLCLPEVFGTTQPSREARLNPPQVVYDAFAGDVWQLGTMFRMFFGNSIPSLSSLFRAMTCTKPSKRPTSVQCLALFRSRINRLRQWQLLRPVRDSSYALCLARAEGLGLRVNLRLAVDHYSEWWRLVKKARHSALLTHGQLSPQDHHDSHSRPSVIRGL